MPAGDEIRGGGVKAPGRETCPTCGQTINGRYETLTAPLVRALYRVYLYCLRTGRHEFSRKELNPILQACGSTASSKFGYWKWFSNGAIYTPEGIGTRGRWGFNIERLAEFFAGERMVMSRILVAGGKSKPFSDRVTRLDPVHITGIKGVQELIDEDGDYIVPYE